MCVVAWGVRDEVRGATGVLLGSVSARGTGAVLGATWMEFGKVSASGTGTVLVMTGMELGKVRQGTNLGLVSLGGVCGW